MASTEATSAITETKGGNGNKLIDVAPSTQEVVDDKSPKTPPFSNYWRILSFGTRFEHAVVILAVVSSAASGVALPLLNIVLGGLAGDFTKYFTPGYNVPEEQFKASVATAALYIVYLAIAKFVLTYVARLGFRVMGLRISAAMRMSYMQALFAQPIEKLDRTSTGTVASTITQSSNTIQLSISDRLASFFQSLALIVAAFAIAFRYSWALTLVTSSGILFIIIVYSITTPFAIKAQHAVDKADEKHATVAAEAVTSIRTVSALNAESKMINKHSKWVDQSHRNSMKLAIRMGGQLTPIYFAIYSCFALAFWFGLKLYREGHIADVGVVIIVFFSVLIVTSVMGSVVQPIMDIVKAISASGAFFDMIDSETVNATGLREPAVSALGDIELKAINFAYPTRPNVQVLKDINLTFQTGKTTALVGPSGCGKSTIVALVERWYELYDGENGEPDEQIIAVTADGGLDATEREGTAAIAPTGAITMLGHNISNFDLRWWRTQIGLVQQDPFLFNDTIENNVAHGLIGTSYENAEPSRKFELVKEACREAFADEFIMRLPDGYASKVGEGGIKLSGGQRQRLAIARSIVRKPAILILDEATSAIDVRGERIVQEALDRASQNRTTIMIAHRLSTIRKADKIVVLRNGTKIEEGTHEQLIADPDGLYKKLIISQHIEEEMMDSHPENETGIDSHDFALQPTTLSEKCTRTLSKIDSVQDEQDAEMGIPSSGYKQKKFFQALMVILHGQRKHWLTYVLLLFGVMSCGAANALQSWFFAQLIQAFTYTGQRLVDAGNFWSLMYFILALTMALCYAVLGTSSGIISAHVGSYFRKQYFTDTLRMPITYFDQEENASGSVMQRLSSDPKQLQELVGLQSAFPLISVFSVVGSAIIAFYFGWKLTLVTFFAVMPLIILSHYIRVRQEFTLEKVNATVFASSSQFATEAIGAFRTVSSLAMEDFVIAKYQRLLQEQIRTSTRKAIYGTLIYAFSESIELCGMALTFWYGGQLLASKEYNPLQFFVVYSAIILGAQSAGQSLSITTNIALSKASANRIFELQSVADNDSRETGSGDLPALGPEVVIEKKPQLGASVEFNNVNFSYDSNPAPLFSNLDITISPGQFVGFVGPSGCGKTTTISLLERFYQPTSGMILFNNQDITGLNTRTYRRSLALVPQEPRLFSGTIRQNLLIGVPDETTVTEETMIQACRDAEIHDFIISLPDGYDTDLGQSSSTSLSGGQKQRMCLARALLRKPRLLLLDEATSSLDSQSERLVQFAIERLAGERAMTVIAVAHRLATIQKADVIYVFGERDIGRNRGSKIVEKGTHAQLLAKRGIYWSMCQAQALDR